MGIDHLRENQRGPIRSAYELGHLLRASKDKLRYD